MKICDIRYLCGPNVFHNDAVLVMTLDLEDFAEIHSALIPGFTDRLLALMPGLREHHCSPRYPGGFVERLRRGTYMGHIVEHVALDMSTPAGIPMNYGKTVSGDGPSIYRVAVRCDCEEGMRFLLQTAVELVEAVIAERPFPLEAKLVEARRIVTCTDLGPSTKALLDAAKRRNIPTMRLNEDSLFQLGYGKYRKFIEAAVTGETSLISAEIASDKSLAKTLLRQASIPVPRGEKARNEAEALAAFDYMRAPVTVKPLDGHHGDGVSVGLHTEEEVRVAFRLASHYSRMVLVEECFLGRDYRALVIGGKLIAAAERVPAAVVGDGKSSLQELIALENESPLRGEGHEKPMTKIRIDAVAEAFLARTGRDLSQIPARGERVPLRATANLSTGGTAQDVTDIVHPDIVTLCERAARVIGLDVCGIDLILDDISAPPKAANGVIEINSGPGLRMHTFPSIGQSRDVADAIVDRLFPQGSSSRIPIISVTGTNGKTTVTRLVAHVIAQTGQVVGMTTSDGIHIAGNRVATGDTTGPSSARTVLCDPAVEVAVLETARGGIVRRGLGYDWSDIGVMTNIQPDHIGQDGIIDIDDILHIKSLVAERVREGGTVVLNADDESLARLMEHPRLTRLSRKVLYFSVQARQSLIERHVQLGGTAYFLRKDQIVEANGNSQRVIVSLHDVPLTLNGTAEFQVANALAAVAACRAYGLSAEMIAQGLKSFVPNEHNHGRANIYRVGSGYLIADYGHNPDAFKAICHMTAKWETMRVTGVIAVPGDRADSVIQQSGEIIARGFDRIILREDNDLRGRPAGEAARLLLSVIQREAPELDCRIVSDQEQALATAVRQLGAGEIVVYFYEEVEHLSRILDEIGAEPTATIPELATSSHNRMQVL